LRDPTRQKISCRTDFVGQVAVGSDAVSNVTYGDYVLTKVGNVFPELKRSVL
jgi:hypothetical protein